MRNLKFLILASGVLAQKSTQNAPQKKWVCKDTLLDNGCAKFDSSFCENFYHANYQCPKTCGKCEGDPLRPINTVGVCYRDSPCNEKGTDGGNKGPGSNYFVIQII